MKVYTAHVCPDRPSPRLLREGFSLSAAVFGPLWLLAHRAWVPAILAACAYAAVVLLTDHAVRLVLVLALAWLIGLCGLDMVRWALERRGYRLAHVIEARTEDGALFRLLDNRPDLIREAVRSEAGR